MPGHLCAKDFRPSHTSCAARGSANVCLPSSGHASAPLRRGLQGLEMQMRGGCTVADAAGCCGQARCPKCRLRLKNIPHRLIQGTVTHLLASVCILSLRAALLLTLHQQAIQQAIRRCSGCSLCAAPRSRWPVLFSEFHEQSVYAHWHSLVDRRRPDAHPAADNHGQQCRG